VKRRIIKVDFPYFKTYVLNAGSTDANTFKTQITPINKRVLNF
jgi:hypothetical protein